MGDEDEVGGKNDLIATWTINDVDFVMTIDGQDLVTWFVENTELTQTQAEELAEIFEGEMGISTNGTVTSNDDNTFTLNFDGDVENGTWSKNGDQLTLNTDGEVIDLDILTLNSNTLIVQMVESETEDMDDDGSVETLEMAITMHFDK